MKYIKILLISVILILYFTINVNANEDIVLNLINKYLDSYLTENIEDDLKLRNYKIKKINIISENDNEIIAQYEAEITPYSENHSWATTNLCYYIKIEKNNNEWKILKQQTSPFEIKNKKLNTPKQITHQLIENYLKSYQTESIEDSLKLRNFEIKEINIISEKNNEIIAQYKAEIIPYLENHSWATTNLYYYIKIEKINDKWEISKQQTSPFEIKDDNNKSQNNNFNITSKTITSTMDKDYTVSKTILPQSGIIIRNLLIPFIIIISIISLIIYYKSKT